MNETPFVSVIIPVYNAGKYLAATIESVCAQTYRNIEIVLVNDGSTDNSESIMSEYASRDARIICKSTSNQGPSGARLTGIAMARGEYVHFLDSDDLMVPEAIERSVARAVETGADIVIPKFWFQWLNGSRTESYGTSEPLMEGKAYLRDALMGKGYWCVWVLTRRSLYSAITDKATDISFGEDAIWKTQLLLSANRVAGVDMPLIIYNERPQSLSHSTSHNAARFAEFKRYVGWIYKYINDEGLQEYMDEALAVFHVNNVCQQMSWRCFEGIEDGLDKICSDLSRYPDLLKSLRRRHRKIIRAYRRFKTLGMLRLKWYALRGKL